MEAIFSEDLSQHVDLRSVLNLQTDRCFHTLRPKMTLLCFPRVALLKVSHLLRVSGWTSDPGSSFRAQAFFTSGDLKLEL